MKIRRTSVLLLAYMLIQLMANYASVFGIFEESANIRMPVAFMVDSDPYGDTENMAEHESVMQNCSQCVDGTHCIFSSCPMLPLSLSIPVKISGSPEVIIFSHKEIPEQYLENLFRPPIFS